MHRPSTPRRTTQSPPALPVVILAAGSALAWALPGVVSAEAPAKPPAVVAELQRTVVELAERVRGSVVAVSRMANPAGAGAQGQAALENGAPNQRGPQVPVPAGVAAPQPFDPLGDLRANAALNPPAVTGAGVVIGEGLVLTQYLVVEPGETHFVTDASGERWGAEVRAADPRSGLAVLRLVRAEGVDTEFPPTLPIGSAEELRRGSFVVAVGNPYAIEAEGGATVSWGVVSNIARKAPANENYNDVPDQNGAYRTTLHHFGTLLQTDAKLGWGAAGGALVDLDGSLVGITTTTSTIPGHESSAGYAIPMNATMRRVIDRLVEGREAEYGLLGVAFNPMATADPLGRPSGMVIDSAYQGSPAQRAGLRQGDVIVRVSGEPTPDADALQRVVGGIPPGTDAFVEFRRDNAMQQTKVRVGKAFVVGDRVVTKKQPAWRGMRVDFPTAVPPMILQQKAQQGLLDPAGCVVISEVEPDSVSWRSGVRPYMFVSHVGGDRVTSPDEFYRAVATAPQSVKLKFTEGVASPPINAAAGVPAEVPPPAPPVAPIVPPGWGRGLVPEQPAEADGAPDPVAPAFEPLSPRVEDEPGKPR